MLLSVNEAFATDAPPLPGTLKTGGRIVPNKPARLQTPLHCNVGSRMIVRNELYMRLESSSSQQTTIAVGHSMVIRIRVCNELP